MLDCNKPAANRRHSSDVQQARPKPPGSPVTIHLYVDDVDAFSARAVAAGAKVTMPVADLFRGDRHGQLEDPFGHRWSVATHVRDMSTAEMQGAMAANGQPRLQKVLVVLREY